jgi:hypothetical protein
MPELDLHGLDGLASVTAWLVTEWRPLVMAEKAQAKLPRNELQRPPMAVDVAWEGAGPANTAVLFIQNLRAAHCPRR